MTEEQLNQLLVGSGSLPGSVEDLTGEVHNLMMREWLDPWSASTTPSPDMSEFDPQQLASDFDAHQLSLQLESFFQDPLEDGMVQSPYYDEMTFVPEDCVQPSIMQQQQQEEEEIQVEEEEITLQELDAMVPVQQLKRRRSSSSSESSSSEEEDDSSDEEDDDVIPTTVANVNNRQRYWSDSSDSEEDDEPLPSRASSPTTTAPSAYAYMHKRQIEETLLSKITNQLQQEKLPGILAILSSENKAGKHDDEVEIDLSRLARDQLVRLLCYVEACIGEQNGGPAVNVADYIVKEKQIKKKVQTVSDAEDSDVPRKQRRRQPKQPRKRQTRQELTEDILADDDESDEDDDKDEGEDVMAGLRGHGPMSMAELSKRQDAVRSSSSSKKSRKRVKRRSLDDAPVSSSSVPAHVEGSIAVSRPKRSAAQRKRRLSDDSDMEDGRRSNSSSGSELIVYGDEKMDFNVKDNKTIVHESTAPVVPVVPVVTPPVIDDEEDLDEEIDIML
ncbi:hypothetical protein BJV82DRAFT_592643 [Fennellomyces sp. T-0311]|nr:hypothetical protein BJV82DRAFT_592643 [Fennellomyces sp. T-0311]